MQFVLNVLQRELQLITIRGRSYGAPSGEPKPSPKVSFLRRNEQAAGNARILVPHAVDDLHEHAITTSIHDIRSSGCVHTQKGFHRGQRSINCDF